MIWLGHHANINEIITKKIVIHEASVAQYLPISGNNPHNIGFNRNKSFQNSINANQRLRNNINITNNSSYDDNKLSFNKNLKSSKFRNFEDKENISSLIYKKNSTEKTKSTNIPLEIINKKDENNNLRNSQIQIKYLIENKNANANLKSSNSTIAFKLNNPINNYNQPENMKKPILEKKISETIIEKEKLILGNFNKIEKLRNLELKDLDSLEMKTNETNNSNNTGSYLQKNSNDDADFKNKEKDVKRNSKKSSSNFAEKHKLLMKLNQRLQ